MRRLYGYETEKFVAFFWFVGWDCVSLGVHVSIAAPNFELHVPFGFFRIGWAHKPNPIPVYALPPKDTA